VEETLNAMLDAEADRLCRAERYERTEACKDTRAGSYQRQLHTKVGEVTLKVPKLRNRNPSRVANTSAFVSAAS
jgi:transposase-like protein